MWTKARPYVRVAVLGIALTVLYSPAQVKAFESWDKKFNNATGRFKVLNAFNDEAVLDKETGLVWERAPSPGPFTWELAVSLCYTKSVGSRHGWRLPAVAELASLIDPTQTVGTALQPGHPFQNVQLPPAIAGYWSATSLPLNIGTPPATHAFFVRFDTVGPGASPDLKGTPFGGMWCVRSGRGHDFQ